MRHVDLVFLKDVAAGLDLGNIEDIVDDVEKMAATAMDVVRIFPVAVAAERAEHFLTHDFGKADNGVERRAQLMAHVRKEFCFRAVCHFRRFRRLPQTFFRATAFDGDAGKVSSAHYIIFFPFAGRSRLREIHGEGADDLAASRQDGLEPDRADARPAHIARYGFTMVFFLQVRRDDLMSCERHSAEVVVFLALPEAPHPFGKIGGKVRRGASDQVFFRVQQEDRRPGTRMRFFRTQRKPGHDLAELHAGCKRTEHAKLAALFRLGAFTLGYIA